MFHLAWKSIHLSKVRFSRRRSSFGLVLAFRNLDTVVSLIVFVHDHHEYYMDSNFSVRKFSTLLIPEKFSSVATLCVYNMMITHKISQNVNLGINWLGNGLTWTSLPMHTSYILHSLNKTIDKILRSRPRSRETELVFFCSLPCITK